jgi:hypothetical protein
VSLLTNDDGDLGGELPLREERKDRDRDREKAEEE